MILFIGSILALIIAIDAIVKTEKQLRHEQ